MESVSRISLGIRRNTNGVARIELTLGWYGKLDSLDVAMLNLLAHGPHVS